MHTKQTRPEGAAQGFDNAKIPLKSIFKFEDQTVVWSSANLPQPVIYQTNSAIQIILIEITSCFYTFAPLK